MLLLHEVHGLDGDQWDAFERRIRDDWLPAVATGGSARLAWYATSTAGAISFPEVVTMTAVEDGNALVALGDRMRDGDLAGLARTIAGMRRGTERRVLKPLVFDPLQIEVADVSVEPVDGDPVLYMHDFVAPRIGQHRAYEEAMRKIYMAMSDNELTDITLWAGLEPVPGGGPSPAEVNISRINNVKACVDLLANEIAREKKQMNTWMLEALKVRDTWTTRLVRSARWSPIR